MPSNTAAWLLKSQAPGLEIKEAPYTSPGPNEIVVRVRAVALNPVDNIQMIAGFVYSWLKYPAVLGTDVAGEVVEVGKDSRFHVGDRVTGYAAGQEKVRNSAAEGAFQHYVVLVDHMTSRIPDSVPYEQACVVPLGLMTAATGLFDKTHLALPIPSAQPSTPTGQVVIVWGGSTSVGCNAIQLAAAAGCTVLTTCSPRNNDLVRSLGAAQVFDYKSASVRADLLAACKGKEVAGALAIGNGGAETCLSILRDRSVKGNKVLALVSFPLPNPLPTSFVVPRIMSSVVPWMIKFNLSKLGSGVKTGTVWGGAPLVNEIGPAIWHEYVEKALPAGGFVCKPEPEVVGEGLDKIQLGLDTLKKGVSATKVVVRL